MRTQNNFEINTVVFICKQTYDFGCFVVKKNYHSSINIITLIFVGENGQLTINFFFTVLVKKDMDLNKHER